MRHSTTQPPGRNVEIPVQTLVITTLDSSYSPHSLTATWTAVAVTRPSATAWPFVSASSAFCAILNPVAAWSTASTWIDTPLYVSCQHVPH